MCAVASFDEMVMLNLTMTKTRSKDFAKKGPF